jgi:hypothetical protein
MARVWDRARGEQLRSPTFRSAAAARAWRADTLDKLARGELPDVRSDLRLGKAVERFVAAARDGRSLTKHGRRYKPKADRRHRERADGPRRARARRQALSDVRRGDVQRLVDDLTAPVGQPRAHVVNALRSLYRWAQDRDHVGHNPAALVRLPAMNATRPATASRPPEFEQLLAALEAPDASRTRWPPTRPRAARRSASCAGATSTSTRRRSARRRQRGAQERRRAAPVPLVRPLRALLRAEWVRQGQPAGHQLVCPPLQAPRPGVAAVDRRRAHPRLRRVGGRRSRANPLLQECRHTAASWLNAAGVNPKVASQIMGHETLARAAAAAAGAAQITLGRYTHTLPGDLERARELLDAYLDEALKTARETGS